VAKVGSFNTKGLLALAVTAGQGLENLGRLSGSLRVRPPSPSVARRRRARGLVPGTLRRPSRVVNPLGYTRRP